MNRFRNKWFIIVLILLVLASVALLFRKQLGPLLGGYKKSPRGYYFRFKEGHELEKVKGEGYHIVFQYLLLGPNGDTVENHALPGVQLERKYPVDAKNEMDDVMQIAAPGSMVEIIVPTDTIKSRVTNNIKVLALESGKNAKFVLKIINVLNDEDFAAYENQRKLERLKSEFAEIDKYAKLHRDSWVLDTPSNIKYAKKVKNTNPHLTFGNQVEFNCEVWSLKGDLIVNSGMEGKKYRTVIGSNTFSLEGLETALELMAEGEEATFLVTSDYGFKDKAYLSILPPYSPLLMKIKDVKKVK
jgi:FKBP-type peptidyl-prolyl cis-trans isomerase